MISRRRVGAGFLAIALASAATLLTAPAAHAVSQNYDVTSLADSGAGSLREAVDLANLNNGDIDTITFTIPGTITLTSGQIVITDGVVISGDGFAPTITRSGNQAILVIDIDPGILSVDRNVFLEDLHLEGAAPTTGFGIFVLDTELLASLTISESSFNDFDGPFEGGVLRVLGLSGDVRIFDSTFSNNDSAAQGGAISVAGAPDGVFISDGLLVNNTASNGGALSVTGSGQVTFVDSTFSGNSSPTAGGAAYLSGNTGLLVSRSNFVSNQSSNNSGGAIHVGGGVNGVAVRTSSFTSNHADGNGGAMNIVGVNGLEVSGSSFTNNDANSLGGALSIDGAGAVGIADAGFTGNDAVFGGAISITSLTDDIAVERAVFSGNDAGLNGGAISIPILSEGASITNCTFASNTAADPNGPSGGAIWASDISGDQTLQIGSSTFAANQAADRGIAVGVDAMTDGQLVIENSTIFENDPSPDAIAVGLVGVSSAFVLVSTTVIANGAVSVGTNNGLALISNSIINGDVNAANQSPVTLGGGDPIVVEWTIVTTAFQPASMLDASGNQFSTDPQLGALAFNGGYTYTMLPDSGSPAINAGDPAYNFASLGDQRGVSRIAQGRVDIGAVEVQAAALAATGLEIGPVVPLAGGGIVLLGIAVLLVARRRIA